MFQIHSGFVDLGERSEGSLVFLGNPRKTGHSGKRGFLDSKQKTNEKRHVWNPYKLRGGSEIRKSYDSRKRRTFGKSPHLEKLCFHTLVSHITAISPPETYDALINATLPLMDIDFGINGFWDSRGTMKISLWDPKMGFHNFSSKQDFSFGYAYSYSGVKNIIFITGSDKKC